MADAVADGLGVGLALGADFPAGARVAVAAGVAACADGDVVAWCAGAACAAAPVRAPTVRAWWRWCAWLTVRSCGGSMLAGPAGDDAANATLVEIAASVVAVAAATPSVSFDGACWRAWLGRRRCRLGARCLPGA